MSGRISLTRTAIGLLIFSSVFVGFLVTTRRASAQPPAGPVIRSEVRLIEVPVVVLDRNTKAPVRGLTAADFELSENGRPQRIEHFNFEESAAPSSSRRSAPVDATPGAFSNRAGVPRGGIPIVTVLIDGFNARFEEHYYASQAAARTIAESDGSVRWGVYYLGRRGLRVVHDYSSDPGSVVSRLRSMRSAEDFLPAQAGDTVEIRYGDLPNSTARPSGLEAQELARMRASVTLGALRDIGRHLAGIPGRKSLVWLSAGMPMSIILATLPDLWHDAVDALNDGNVAVYAIDSAGVRTPRGFLAEESHRSVSRTASFGSPMAETHVLMGMAEATGGRWYIGTNNLGASFRRALGDSQAFYRLAYRPAHGQWDGRYFRIAAKVRGRKGLEIRHRQGYIARKDEAATEARRDRLLADALASPLDAIDIGLSLRMVPEAGSTGTTLFLTADPHSVWLEEHDGRMHGQFDFRCAQVRADGATVDDFTDEVVLRLAPEEARRTVEEGFRYKRRIAIGAETRLLKIAVCDRATGRVGSLRVPVIGRP